MKVKETVTVLNPKMGEMVCGIVEHENVYYLVSVGCGADIFMVENWETFKEDFENYLDSCYSHLTEEEKIKFNSELMFSFVIQEDYEFAKKVFEVEESVELENLCSELKEKVLVSCIFSSYLLKDFIV